ncbi:MAG: 30S ribosomal protein S16 [Candidatus Eiseniibacteriota bacterium]|jgi:small subunit ribosomal protein S16
MSVVIRLRRAGSKKRPFYHMVVADSRMRRDGRFIEKVGFYNPIPRHEEIEFDAERIDAWITKGAKPTTTVDRLMRRKLRGEVGMSQKERKRAQTAAADGAAAAESPAAAATEPAGEATAVAEAAATETAGTETAGSAEAGAETASADGSADAPAGSEAAAGDAEAAPAASGDDDTSKEES